MDRTQSPRTLTPRRPMRRRGLLLVTLGLAAAIAIPACGDSPPGRLAGEPTPPPKPGAAEATTATKGSPRAWEGPVVPPPSGHNAAQPAPNTESYARLDENPVQPADRDPLSTFAVSVDTASYSNVRRFLLDEHHLPPPDAVRVAELVNYFPYSYPQPVAGDAASITVDLSECPWDVRRLLARVGVRARGANRAEPPPRNLVFLIDTSGSMAEPDRLPLFQRGLRLLVRQLSARDRVAVVTYAGSSFVALPSTPGDRQASILGVIDGLRADGSTNGGAGIQTAYQVAEANRIQGGVNRVILGTDGDFNVGVTGEDLVRLVEARRKDGIFLTVLGFGKHNLKDATMESLAYHGNGQYAYIDGPEELQKVFVEQGAALEAVAKDVKIQVEFNPRRVGDYRLIGYEHRLLRDQDFNDDKKQGGAMGAGHTVTALYEITPAGSPPPTPGVDALKYQRPPAPSAEAGGGEWLTVKLRYKDPDSDASKELIKSLSGSLKMLGEASADFRWAAAVASFGQLLRDSPFKGSATYAAVHDLARGAGGADADGRRAEFLRMIDQAERLTGRRGEEDARP